MALHQQQLAHLGLLANQVVGCRAGSKVVNLWEPAHHLLKRRKDCEQGITLLDLAAAASCISVGSGS